MVRGPMFLFVAASLVACASGEHPARGPAATSSAPAPIPRPSADDRAPVDAGTTEDAVAPLDAGATDAGATDEAAPPREASALSERYRAGEGRCFLIRAYGLHEYEGVAEFRPPASVSFWIASLNARVQHSQHLSGDLASVRARAGTSDVSPYALSASLAFLDSSAAARLNLRAPTREQPHPTQVYWVYEGDGTFPGSSSPVRFFFKQDPATGRVVHFSYVFGGKLSFNSYVVAFLKEAVLRPGEACPFPKPKVSAQK